MMVLLIITLLLVAMGGLHYRVGFDSMGYEKYFDNLRPLNSITWKYIDNSRFAPGFVILASFTKLFTPEPVLLYFIISGFLCGIATMFFVKNTPRPFFALLIFYFFVFTLLIFEQIREAVAVGFFLLAWPSFRSNNWLKWYLLSFCAICFHTSATFMFVLPIILLPGIRKIFTYGKRTWIFMTGVFILAIFLQHRFSKYIELLAVTQSMGELTQKYENTAYVEGNLNIFGMLSMLIKYIFYPAIALVCLHVSKHRDDIETIPLKLEMMVMVSIYVSLLSIGVPIISRFNNYFFFFPIVIMSDLVFQKVELHRKRIMMGFAGWMLFFLPMFMAQVYNSYMTQIDRSGNYRRYMAYYPYTSYLDKEKNQERINIIRKSQRRK